MELSSQKFRIFYGIFMLIYFVRILLSTQSLYSTSPNIYIDTVSMAGATASLFFIFNIRAQLGSFVNAISILLIWYLAPLSYNLGIGYFGFTCLLLSIGINQKNLSREIELSLAIVMSFALTYSGLSKIANPIWRSGEALNYIATDPLFNWSLSSIFTENLWLSKTATFLVIIIEIFAFLGPFLTNKNVRKLFWWSQLVLYLGIFICFEFKFVIIGLLLLHGSIFKSFCYKQGTLFSFK